MSDASDAAIQEAAEAFEDFSNRMTNARFDAATTMSAVAIAKELTLIRGEMRAIRILLSERGEGAPTLSGFDSGNA